MYEVCRLFIELPHLPPREANPNANSHYFTRSKVRREQREEMIAYVLEQGRPKTPFNKAHITITWYAKDKRKRDVDNLLSAMKGSIDGLVEAGVLVDDSAQHLSYSLYYQSGNDVTENKTTILVVEITEEDSFPQGWGIDLETSYWNKAIKEIPWEIKDVRI